MRFVVTYGSNHRDADGRSLGNCYSIVEAPDELAARLKINAVRTAWAFLYTSEDAAGVERFGLELVELGPQKPEAARR